mmetsp:Transcript_18972/g.50322  ORF Transcript_18972/g.50322 Transcript_18972/m.50322 type:complete len:230 (+) Transcript_18972:579-1268(+)
MLFIRAPVEASEPVVNGLEPLRSTEPAGVVSVEPSGIIEAIGERAAEVTGVRPRNPLRLFNMPASGENGPGPRPAAAAGVTSGDVNCGVRAAEVDARSSIAALGVVPRSAGVLATETERWRRRECSRSEALRSERTTLEETRRARGLEGVVPVERRVGARVGCSESREGSGWGLGRLTERRWRVDREACMVAAAGVGRRVWGEVWESGGSGTRSFEEVGLLTRALDYWS